MNFNLIANGLLIHPHQPHNPCYRKVICYAFFRYIKENDVASGKIQLDLLKKNLEQNKLYILDKFLEVYPTTMTANEDYGYVVVESSRGCYPLIAYPESHSSYANSKNKTRKSGFITALNVVHRNQERIFDLLHEHNNWSLDLESKLEPLFDYPSNDRTFINVMKKTGS